MRVALFIPCYVDQFFPRVGLATVEILSWFPQIELIFPDQQTCCGQPMVNSGCVDDARPLREDSSSYSTVSTMWCRPRAVVYRWSAITTSGSFIITPDMKD